MSARPGGQEKQFFFEKKNQKTFVCFGKHGSQTSRTSATANRKKFFASFLQKEVLPYIACKCCGGSSGVTPRRAGTADWPAEVGEQRPLNEHQIGAAAGDVFVGMLGRGDQVDGASDNAGFAPDGFRRTEPVDGVLALRPV